MEHVIRAPLDGVVEDVFFGEVSLRKGRVEAGAFCMMLVVVIYVEGDVAVAGDAEDIPGEVKDLVMKTQKLNRDLMLKLLGEDMASWNYEGVVKDKRLKYGVRLLPVHLSAMEMNCEGVKQLPSQAGEWFQLF